MSHAKRFRALESGKPAVLVVVKGDPVADISLLEDHRRSLLVMQGRRIIS